MHCRSQYSPRTLKRVPEQLLVPAAHYHFEEVPPEFLRFRAVTAELQADEAGASGAVCSWAGALERVFVANPETLRVRWVLAGDRRRVCRTGDSDSGRPGDNPDHAMAME